MPKEHENRGVTRRRAASVAFSAGLSSQKLGQQGCQISRFLEKRLGDHRLDLDPALSRRLVAVVAAAAGRFGLSNMLQVRVGVRYYVKVRQGGREVIYVADVAGLANNSRATFEAGSHCEGFAQSRLVLVRSDFEQATQVVTVATHRAS